MLVLTVSLLAGCIHTSDEYPGDGIRTGPPLPGSAGTLILIGGGLERDNAYVFRRMLALATRPGQSPRVLVATAASLDEAASLASVTTSFRTYDPATDITTINRTTATDAAVAAIDAAHFVFFTGGDQKRIIDLYRPAGVDRPEAAALRRLLARAGTIAGTSAGLAMMSDPMFLTGSSDDALETGPKIGPGMGFTPRGIITDSHFVERARLGRLTAALHTTNTRLGIGLAENAAAELDLATNTLTALSEAPTVVVDATNLTRDTVAIRGLLARSFRRNQTLNLRTLPKPTDRPPTTVSAPIAPNGILANPRPTARHTLLVLPRSDDWLAIEILLNTKPAQQETPDTKTSPD